MKRTSCIVATIVIVSQTIVTLLVLGLLVMRNSIPMANQLLFGILLYDVTAIILHMAYRGYEKRTYQTLSQPKHFVPIGILHGTTSTLAVILSFFAISRVLSVNELFLLSTLWGVSLISGYVLYSMKYFDEIRGFRS